jgi:chemotaxis-related protein WspD
VNPIAINDECWNRIGVRGDQSCVELKRHVHCRNCGVYTAAAQQVLDRPVEGRDVAENTRHVARPKAIDEQGPQTVLIFRVASEWLALPMAVVKEVTEVRAIHSLPHRRGGSLLGVANIRGELLVCVSLHALLTLERDGGTPAVAGRTVHQRLLVLGNASVRAVCPVDEVHGIERVHMWDLQDMPATVAKAAARHTTAVIMWRDHSVGYLDQQLLLTAVQRSFS